MGSLTAPPCEENIVWFVHSHPIPLGSTALNMIKDAIFAPGKSAADKPPNFDGTNR
jgi:carbonic anhydrase